MWLPPRRCSRPSIPTLETYPPIAKLNSWTTTPILPYDILTKVDITSMMHGLECAHPFVDVEVAELSQRFPRSSGSGLTRTITSSTRCYFGKSYLSIFPRILYAAQDGFRASHSQVFEPGELCENRLSDLLPRMIVGPRVSWIQPRSRFSSMPMEYLETTQAISGCYFSWIHGSTTLLSVK